MEVLWTTLSNTLKITESFLKINIPTKVSSKLALRMLVISKSQDTPMSLTATLWPPPLLEDPSQLPLMPPTGLLTNQEFSITVPPNSTTVSSLSVLLTNTGESRTHGLPHGVKVDLSDLLEETLAVSATSLHIPTNDLTWHSLFIIFNHILYIIYYILLFYIYTIFYIIFSSLTSFYLFWTFFLSFFTFFIISPYAFYLV